MTRKGALRALAWPSAFAAAGLVLLVGLGVWQLQRLGWKEGLIRAATERAGQPPAPVPVEADWPRLDPNEAEYRRVRLEGRFRHEDEALVFTDLADPKGPSGGVGSWVMTPLTLDDGSVVLINRGFVPANRADPSRRAEGQVGGEVEIVGLMRWSEARNPFTPADDPAKGAWYTRDTRAIGRAKGLTRVAPFYIDAEASAPGGLPQGGETRLAFPNRHLEYALTWFGLAGALAVVAGLFLRRRARAI